MCLFYRKKEPVSIKIEHNGNLERIGVEPKRYEQYRELRFEEIKDALQQIEEKYGRNKYL